MLDRFDPASTPYITTWDTLLHSIDFPIYLCVSPRQWWSVGVTDLFHYLFCIRLLLRLGDTTVDYSYLPASDDVEHISVRLNGRARKFVAHLRDSVSSSPPDLSNHE